MTGIPSSVSVFGRLALAMLAFIPPACKGKPPEIKNPESLGAWQDGDQTVELFTDGRITLGTDWGTQPATGKYEVVDDDTIKVTFKGSKSQDYTFSLSGDNMIVTRTDGTLAGEYKRVKNTSERGVHGGIDSD